MARPTLQQQVERSRLKREIAENTYRAKVFNYTNTNLTASRKRTLGWTNPGKADRDFNRISRHKAMAMARQRVEENPVAMAIMNARKNNIVGREYRLMMRSGDPAWDTAVENWWMLEKDRLDVSGQRTWGQLLRMWQERRDVDGDVGIALLDQQYEDRPLSYVQTFEAEQIRDIKNTDGNNSGIDFDEFMMPVRYHILADPDDPKSESKVFPRENFILYRNDPSERVNRARGVSLFLQSFSIMQDHADIMDGITQLVKTASFIGLKFRLDASESGNPFGVAGESASEAENGVDYSKVKLIPGTNLVLGEGEDVDVLESKNPTEQVQSFEKILLSRLLLPFGLTYELLTGDYSTLNDRTARVAQKQFEKLVRPEQAALAIPASKIFRWSLSRAVNARIIKPPVGLDTWFNHQWGKPGFPYINILQEAQANVLLLEKGLTSRTKILAEQGDDDFEDLMDELEYENGVISDRGISISSVNGLPVKQDDEEKDDPETDKPDTSND